MPLPVRKGTGDSGPLKEHCVDRISDMSGEIKPTLLSTGDKRP